MFAQIALAALWTPVFNSLSCGLCLKTQQSAQPGITFRLCYPLPANRVWGVLSRGIMQRIIRWMFRLVW